MEILKVAKLVATIAHSGQVDKGGNDYITHPEAVADAVETEEEKTVAWLHDVVEDTYVTLEDLAEVFPAEIVNAVDSITWRPNESRKHYLHRVAANPIAVEVKIADLVHNSDLSRLNRAITNDDRIRAFRYIEESSWLRAVRGGWTSG